MLAPGKRHEVTAAVMVMTDCKEQVQVIIFFLERSWLSLLINHFEVQRLHCLSR